MKRGYGQASIEEHPKGSGLYRVRARRGGKRLLVASKVSRAEAEDIAAGYVVLRNAEAFREGLTLAQFGAQFLARRAEQGIRGIRQDRNVWKNRIELDPIGALPIGTLDRRDIVEWRARLPGAYRTKVRAMNLLRVALSDAVEREILKENPAREVKIHRAGAARSRDDLEGILAPAEQRALVAAMTSPDEALDRWATIFALCTGLRQGEQWWLKWEDVADDHIVVRRSTGGRAPKSGKPRTVPLLPDARRVLDLLPRSSEWVFASRYRGARRAEGAPFRWRLYLERAGITRPVRWHDLRHTCATALLAGWHGRRWALHEVCSMLGHSSVNVTERYARKLGETLRNAVAETPAMGLAELVPYGGEVREKALFLPGKADSGLAFVKRRSSVQIRQSAPALSADSRGQVGTMRHAWLRVARALANQTPAKAFELGPCSHSSGEPWHDSPNGPHAGAAPGGERAATSHAALSVARSPIAVSDRGEPTLQLAARERHPGQGVNPGITVTCGPERHGDGPPLWSGFSLPALRLVESARDLGLWGAP